MNELTEHSHPIVPPNDVFLSLRDRIKAQDAEIAALREDAALGKIAMRFVDRAGDVHPGIDDAETICADFYAAMIKELEPIFAAQRLSMAQAVQSARAAPEYQQELNEMTRAAEARRNAQTVQPSTRMARLIDRVRPGHGLPGF